MPTIQEIAIKNCRLMISEEDFPDYRLTNFTLAASRESRGGNAGDLEGKNLAAVHGYMNGLTGEIIGFTNYPLQNLGPSNIGITFFAHLVDENFENLAMPEWNIIKYKFGILRSKNDMDSKNVSPFAKKVLDETIKLYNVEGRNFSKTPLGGTINLVVVEGPAPEATRPFSKNTEQVFSLSKTALIGAEGQLKISGTTSTHALQKTSEGWWNKKHTWEIIKEKGNDAFIIPATKTVPQQITSYHQLHSGDKLVFGKTVLRIE